MAKQKLTLKEQRFVDLFLGETRGNATEAALQAGYGTNRKSASTLSARLLGKVWIQRAIATRTRQETKVSIAQADERDTILTEIARKASSGTKERISAIKELNKCSGRHSIKHMHEGKLTLEQAIAASRQVRRK